MIDVKSLEQYFTRINEDVPIDKYTFYIALLEKDNDCFTINVIVKQKDTKKEHMIKFRLGIGKDKKQDSVHATEEPHFEIDFYKREEKAFSATLYFTFFNILDEELFKYAKGTVVVIAKMLRSFFESRNLDILQLGKLIVEEDIFTELISFEPLLIDALYECYKNSELIVRLKGSAPIIVKTKHNLQKYLGTNSESQPLYLGLLDKIE